MQWGPPRRKNLGDRSSTCSFGNISSSDLPLAPARQTSIIHSLLKTRTEFVDLTVLGISWLLLVTLTGPVGNFPLNDDWVYGLAVKEILRTGVFSLPSPASANVLLQAYWGALFCLPGGFSFTALRISTIVCGLLGINTSYLLVRELEGGRYLALVCAASLGVNPIYFALSNTFMTDVPFTALCVAALWAFVKGMRHDRPGWIITGFLVALCAVMIRQFALILIAAFGVAYLIRKGLTLRSVCVTAIPLVVGIGFQLGFQHWLMSTGRTPVMVAGDLQDVLPGRSLFAIKGPATAMVKLFIYLGLFLAPCLLVIERGAASCRANYRRWWIVALAATLLVLIGVFEHPDITMPMFDNIITPFGIGPLTLRDTYLLGLNLPNVSAALRVAWVFVTVVSVLASISMATLLVRTASALAMEAIRPTSWPVAWAPAMIMTFLFFYGCVLFLLSHHLGVFDRYLIVMIVPIWMLAIHASGSRTIHRPSALRLGLAGALIAAFAVFSVAGTHDYLAFNRARLAATDALSQIHVPLSKIDGGYEYNGFHGYNSRYQPTAAKSYWWVVDDDYVVSSGPIDDYCLAKVFPYRRWLLNSDARVDILARNPSHLPGNQNCPLQNTVSMQATKE
jgi:hypothetical protein